MGDKTMVCGAGCYKFASMLCNCFIGVSRAAEGPPSVEDPTEGPKVSTARSAPSNPRVHKGTDNITRG